MGRGSRGGLAPDGVPEAAGTARPRASVPASPASCPSHPGVRGSHLSRRRSPEPGDLARCSWGAPSRLAGPSAAVELGRSPPGRMDSPRAAASGWAGSLHRHRLEPSLHRPPAWLSLPAPPPRGGGHPHSSREPGCVSDPAFRSRPGRARCEGPSPPRVALDGDRPGAAGVARLGFGGPAPLSHGVHRCTSILGCTLPPAAPFTVHVSEGNKRNQLSSVRNGERELGPDVTGP